MQVVYSADKCVEIKALKKAGEVSLATQNLPGVLHSSFEKILRHNDVN